MVRRLGSAIVLLIMLSVIALGDGRYFVGDQGDCATEMAHPHQQHPVERHGCDLPWSPGCASAASCVQPAPTVVATVDSEPRIARPTPSAAVFRVPESADIAPDHPPPRA